MAFSVSEGAEFDLVLFGRQWTVFSRADGARWHSEAILFSMLAIYTELSPVKCFQGGAQVDLLLVISFARRQFSTNNIANHLSSFRISCELI